MLEYFAYKKYKKHQAEKEAEKAHASGHREERAPSLVLNEEDELFLRRIAEEGEPPHLPERPVVLNPEVGSTTGNDAQVSRTSTGRSSTERHRKDKGKGKEKENAPWDGKHERPKFSDRLSGLFSRNPKEGLHPKKDVPPHEAVKEQDDIARVLDNLNLSAVNNRAFSLSKESTELVEKFTLVLKDLVNGVPTAYDDLVGLLDDSQGTLAKSYDHLPSFLQKLVTTLPDKLMNNLAPELLAVATEAQGMDFDGTRKGEKSSGGGLMGAAKGFLKPNSLKDLVTKPGAVAGALKTIMNTLKLRWPAFMGTNVLWSLGLFGKFASVNSF